MGCSQNSENVLRRTN